MAAQVDNRMIKSSTSFQSILRSTAILGSSSMVSIIVGLVSAKAWALLLGPVGLGAMGLLQSLVGLAGLFAGMGVGVGLVRMGAAALARGDRTEVSANYRAAWCLFALIGGAVLVGFVVFREPISIWMLGGAQHSNDVILMGIALLFNLAAGIQTSTLNAYHRVAALAKIGILNSILVTGISLLIVWQWGEQGIAPGMIAGAAISWAISRWFLRRKDIQAAEAPTWEQTYKAARALLRFGVPYTASLLVGTGVQLALPVLVLHTLSTESVGFYRAAVAISVNYLGFLLAAMGQDYYPRVSAASDQPATLVEIVNQQHRLVMLLAVPMILGVLALAPYLVPLIYSPQFAPTVDILEWQLIGDLFKFSSWTMGFVILARSSSSTYFVTELIGGISTIVATWVSVYLFGLAGLGLGFLVAYVVYYAVVWLVLRRDIHLVWTLANKRMFFYAMAAAACVRALPFIGAVALRTPVALVFACCAGFFSLYTLWREIGAPNAAQAS